MRIEKLELSNYRGLQNVSLRFGSMNVIVGENNVGKSTLLLAIQMASSVHFNSQLPVEFWPESRPDGDIALSVELTLGKDQMERIAFDCDFQDGGRQRLDGEEFAQRFGNHAKFSTHWHRPNQAASSSLALVNNARSTPIEPNLGGYSSNQGQITLGSQVFATLQSTAIGSMIFFPEFRLRPVHSADEVFSAPDGARVTGVLFSLKNGSRDQQEKYRRIKDHFAKLFPSLKMELHRTGSIPRIMIENVHTSHEVPLDTLGAGIAEMIIMLTHLEGEEQKIFFIDEPELHLHPHSQRLLRRVLMDSLPTNQLILATHSAQFVDLSNVGDIILMRESEGKSRVLKLDEDYLTEDEKRRVSRIIQSEEKEFLFSRRVLLVEGPTEYGAMPILARKLHRDFDGGGVSVVFVGGNYFALFLKLLAGYGFPWRSLCDRDVLMSISCKLRFNGEELKASPLFDALMAIQQLKGPGKELLSKCQAHIHRESETEVFDDTMFDSLNLFALEHGFHVLSPDFERFLKARGFEPLFQEAAELYGKSKVLQGRYVADRMSSVPRELELVIQAMTPISAVAIS